MNVQKAAYGFVGTLALTAVLTACGSSGSSNSDSLAQLAGAPAPVTVSPAHDNSAPTPSVPAPSTAPAIAVTVHPAAAGDGQVTAAAPKAPSGPSHNASSPVVLTGPVTFSSYSFPRPYNCTESGTTYYTPPNIEVAMDVTVLVNSATLAHDLSITAPNRAPRGLSNTSSLVSSAALGNGVWRSTYRTYVALSEPHYTPFTVSSLAATAGGAKYTIAFPAAVAVTLDDCHS
jgi:hypothetical protein